MRSPSRRPSSRSSCARSRTCRSPPGLDRTPPVYLIDDDAPNAFAAGRKPSDAYVAATTGLVELMDQRELEGVMAHEISHIRNRDVRLMTLAAVLVGVIALMADLLIRISLFGGGRRTTATAAATAIALIIAIAALVLAPISAALLQMALSRRREYLADASAAEITGDPEGLALRAGQARQRQARRSST